MSADAEAKIDLKAALQLATQVSPIPEDAQSRVAERLRLSLLAEPVAPTTPSREIFAKLRRGPWFAPAVFVAGIGVGVVGTATLRPTDHRMDLVRRQIVPRSSEGSRPAPTFAPLPQNPPLQLVQPVDERRALRGAPGAVRPITEEAEVSSVAATSVAAVPLPIRGMAHATDRALFEAARLAFHRRTDDLPVLLREHETRFPNSVFVEERLALWIQHLLRENHADAAREKLQELRRVAPESVYVRRFSAALE